MIELIQGDCLLEMQNIPNKSIDAIICDLPYGTTQNKWDSVIDFNDLWSEYKRIIKDNGAIVLFAAQPFTSALIMSNPKMFKYDWVWQKPKGTGHLNAKKQPMRNKEDILVFYKKQCTYNPQMVKGEPYKAKAGKSKANHNGEDCYGKYGEAREDNIGLRYPMQIIEYGIKERNKLHPTEKPTPLLEYLVNTYTNEGEAVLDNTMGSGTTAIACMNTNRNFIGIELDKSYFAIAKKRVEEKRKEKEFTQQCLFETPN
jgi:site-specific DNA-methyltransferase (adenine-specific)